MTSHALKSFWKCYERLPAHVQKLADKKKVAFTQSKSVAATELLLESETVITIGSG